MKRWSEGARVLVRAQVIAQASLGLGDSAEDERRAAGGDVEGVGNNPSTCQRRQNPLSLEDCSGISSLPSSSTLSPMSPLLRIQGGVTMARVLGIGLGRSREALEVVRLLNEELELESKERDVELLRARLGSVKTRLQVCEGTGKRRGMRKKQMREGDVKGAWATQVRGRETSSTRK
eukprot:767174-Hanusia_phi.AAC.1